MLLICFLLAPLKTHYDTLGVSRNADDDTIKIRVFFSAESTRLFRTSGGFGFEMSYGWILYVISGISSRKPPPCRKSDQKQGGGFRDSGFSGSQILRIFYLKICDFCLENRPSGTSKSQNFPPAAGHFLLKISIYAPKNRIFSSLRRKTVAYTM